MEDRDTKDITFQEYDDDMATARQQARAEMKAECLAAVNQCIGTMWNGDEPLFNIGVRIAINAVKALPVEVKL